MTALLFSSVLSTDRTDGRDRCFCPLSRRILPALITDLRYRPVTHHASARSRLPPVYPERATLSCDIATSASKCAVPLPHRMAVRGFRVGTSCTHAECTVVGSDEATRRHWADVKAKPTTTSFWIATGF